MKKTWKRLGALFLAVAMTLTLLPTAAFADDPADEPDLSAEYLSSASDSSRDINTSQYTMSAGAAHANHDTEGPADYAKDGNESTWWHTGYSSGETTGADVANRWIAIELPSATWVSAFRYLPRGDKAESLTGTDNGNGYVTKYQIQIKADDNATEWTTVAEGDWNTYAYNTAGTENTGHPVHGWQVAYFAPVQAKYIRLVGVETRGSTNVNAHMHAAEVRVVGAKVIPGATYTISGNVYEMVGGNKTAVEGATVQIGSAITTTDENGAFTVENMAQQTTHTAIISKAGYLTATQSIAMDTDDVTGVEVTLEKIARSITGKVVDSEGEGIDGATVTLVQDNATYTIVSNSPSATTDGNGEYTMDVSGLTAGSYKVRASKEGYGAAICGTAVNVTSAATLTVESAQVALTAIDTEAAAYKWNFDDAGSQPSESALSHTTNAAIAYENGEMKLTWSSGDRAKNLIGINNTNAKNCVIEFDATRNSSNSIRFGVAMRSHTSNGATYWIYVGQDSTAAGNGWGVEAFRTTSTATSSTWWNYSTNGPTFKAGETRHFKITIEDGTITMSVDGVQVVNVTDLYSHGSTTVPLAELNVAGDVGLIWGNSDMTTTPEHSITVDNLYVFRNDPTNEITVTALDSGNGTLTATYTDNGEEKTDLTDVPEGVTVTVAATGTPAGKALGAVTVTETTPAQGETARTVTATLQEDGSFTFVMPDYSVTVTGELKNTFEPSLPTGDDGNTIAPQQGKAYDVTLDPSAATASYQWYRVNSESQSQTAITGATSASYTPVAADVGNTLRVVVTGTGDYTGIHTLNTAEVGAPDVEVTNVSLDKETVDLWMNNGENAKTDTLTVTVTPGTATNPTIEWSSSDDNVVTVAASNDAKTATLTAVGNGAATITVTVTSANGTTFTDTCAVTVSTKVTGITVKNNGEAVGNDPIIVYDNDDDAQNSVVLTAEVTPATASNKNLVWTTEDDQDLIHLSTPDSNGEVTITDIDADEQAVGQVIVWVTAQADEDVTASFIVEVRHKLAEDHNVSITGTPKYGSVLGVNTNELLMTSEGKQALTYQWYRLENATDSIDENAEPIGETATYTLTANDIGKYIAVVVTADETTYYEGSKTAVTAQIQKADGPAIPSNTTIAGEAVTEAGNDGKITGFGNDYAQYEYKAANDEDIEDNWHEVTGTEVTGLAAGEYEVRIKETETHKAGEAITVTVEAYGVNSYAINLDPAMTNGTVSRSAAREEEGHTVTLTVRPNTGYQLKEDSLKVTKADGSEVEVTAVAGTNQFTFAMPGEAVTVSAEFEKIKVKITHNLTNLTCDLTVHDADGNHVVDYQTGNFTITLTPADGYRLPTTIRVTKTSDNSALGDAVDYDSATGKITFPNGVTEDITITAAGVRRQYTVQFRGLSGQGPANGVVAHGEKLEATLTAPLGYTLPDEITVTMGGSELAANGYTYTKNAETGAGTVTIASVTGNVVITGTPVATTTPVDSVTITIGHQDVDVVSNTPHVGDVLSADVAPTGASVDYAWYVSGIENPVATTKNYTVGPNDLGKTIKVVVTGKGLFSGEKEATTTAVGATVKLPTSITLSAYNHGMSVGESFTLTATIAPADATDKTITWSVLDAVSDTEVDGVVTLRPGTNGRVTVTATAPGTVRICATTANGRSVDCTLTIERANSYAVGYMINGGNSNVSMTVDGEPVNNGGMVEAGKTVTITVTPNDQTHNVALTAARTTGEPVVVTRTANAHEWTFTMPAGDVRMAVSVGANVKPVTGVTLEETTATVAVGETVTLHAQVQPADADNQNLIWTSDDEEIATVGETGVVTGVKAGTAVITVETAGSGFQQSCTVTVTAAAVTNVPVTGVSLDRTTLSLNRGETATLTHTITPGNATNQSVTWSSSNDAVATVTGGVVFARGEGTATITVTTEDGSKTATCNVTVTDVGYTPVGSIIVTAPGSTTIYFAEGVPTTVQMSAEVSPALATDKTVTWSSSDVTVATVDPATGLVTIVGTGTVNIIATSNDDNTVSGSCLLTVEAATVAVTGVSLKASDTIRVGDTITLVPTFTPANATNKDVVWASGDNETASVSKDANGNGLVTALTTGTTTITVTTVDGGYTATCTVTVVAADAVVPVESVTVTAPNGGAISFGTTEVTLIAEVNPSAADQSVTWSSGDETIATVDRNGVVTILSTGTVTITATSVDDGTKSGTCTLTITTVAATGVSLDKSTLDLTVGESDTLVATVAPADASDKSVTWTSSAPAIAEVDENGRVTAKAAGTATITVTTNDGSYTFDCTVTVTANQELPGLGTLTPPSTTTTTTTNPDGSTTTTVTDNVTGTVTETTVDPEGGKVEKVTTPDEGVTITVTNADGEELAKVEIPAEIPALDADKTFTDVREGYFAEEAINNMAALGVVNGKGDRIFDPKSPMKRSELAKVLYELANGKEGFTTDFTDVPSTKWYADSVAWAVKAGVVKGVSDTEFEPERTITREELAAMLCRYARMLGMDTTAQTTELDAFSDGATTHAWAASDMAWCVQNGILQGKGSGVLDPRSEATRAEVAVMLQRFIDLMK